MVAPRGHIVGSFAGRQKEQARRPRSPNVCVCIWKAKRRQGGRVHWQRLSSINFSLTRSAVFRLARPHGDRPKNRRSKTVPALRRYSPPVLIAVIALHLLSRRRRRALGRLEIFRQSQAYFQRRPKSPNPSERALEHRVQLQKRCNRSAPCRSAETRPYHRPRESHLAPHCQKSRQRRARRAP